MFNYSEPGIENSGNAVDRATSGGIKVTAYGGDSNPDRTKGERYTTDYDGVLQSADMTIVSGKGLNITGIHVKKSGKAESSNKNTEIEDLGRLDTQEDEFDVNAIAKVHETKKMLNENDKKAIGMSQNIFDVSSYGEVRLNAY